MATLPKNLSKFDSTLLPSARGMRFGIVVSDYNPEVTHQLLESCLSTLVECGAKQKDISVAHVPGAFELPAGVHMLASSRKFDALICLGCVIKGETQHDEYINHAVAGGITQLSLLIGAPVIYGVLTTNNLKQAKERAGGKHGNKGVEAADTAIRMVALGKELKR